MLDTEICHPFLKGFNGRKNFVFQMSSAQEKDAIKPLRMELSISVLFFFLNPRYENFHVTKHEGALVRIAEDIKSCFHFLQNGY